MGQNTYKMNKPIFLHLLCVHILQENLRITSVELPVHLRYHKPAAPQESNNGMLGVGGLAGELLPSSFSGVSGAQSQGGAQPQLAYSASSPGILKLTYSWCWGYFI